MTIIRMDAISLKGKQVLVREDFNVPQDAQGNITSDARIRAALPTLKYLIQQGAGVRVMSHLGRPKEGVRDPAFSLQPIAHHLSTLLDTPVKFEPDWLSGGAVKPGCLHVCENVRFELGEESNHPELAQRMARLCDVFVMDAFGTAHRKQASTYGVAQYAPVACGGFLLMEELDALSKAVEHPQAPVVAIVGGSKVSTKLSVLKNLIPKVNYLIVGGGIANTFLAAQGFSIGTSLYEPDWVNEAKNLLSDMSRRGSEIILPQDVRVAHAFSDTEPAVIKNIDQVGPNEMILDIGPLTEKRFHAHLISARTIIWNGPVGVFEFPAFRSGTERLARSIAESSAFSLAGGGDTLAAIDLFDIQQKISYISTGGGAFLEFIEGKKLPAVEILEARGIKP